MDTGAAATTKPSPSITTKIYCSIHFERLYICARRKGFSNSETYSTLNQQTSVLANGTATSNNRDSN
jgi:hypothetical protein